jgi:hypothetical protein
MDAQRTTEQERCSLPTLDSIAKPTGVFITLSVVQPKIFLTP